MPLAFQAANICLDHSPRHGGLYRAVNDFASAIPGPIVSFTTTADGSTTPLGTHSIACGEGLGTRSCHILSRRAATIATAATRDADLLVVHSLFRAHNSWAQRHSRRYGIPYWAVPHGCLDPWGLSHRTIAKRLWLTAVGRRYLADASHVICSTDREREKAAAWLPPKRAVVVNWPVTLPGHIDHGASRRRLRLGLGIPDDSLVLLFMGRLHSMKRLPETIGLFCEAHRAPWHLVVAGMDGDISREQMASQIPARFHDWVHLIGPVTGDKWTDAYAGSDAFISLSYRENFGYSIAEATAFGLPLLVSDGHDLTHEMPQSSNGMLACGWRVRSNTPAEWRPALDSLISSTASDRAIRGAVGCRWAADALSFDRFRDALYRLADTAVLP
jgi:glycosyltransferase involved in cell wall biosynthesis